MGNITRTIATVCTTLLAAAGLLLGVAPAEAQALSMEVVSLADNPYANGGSHFMRVNAGSTGNIAYCAQGWLITPAVGQVLKQYGSLGIPELDYVMWHGYDGSVVTSLYGLDPQRSEAATALAIWLAIGDQRGDVLDYQTVNGNSFHGNKAYMERWQNQADQQVKDAAWRLYQEGLTYRSAGGGGVEAGCATLWRNNTPVAGSGGAVTYDYQALLTVEKQVEVTFEKSSARPSITEGNGIYTQAGAAYSIYRASDGTPVGQVTTGADGRGSIMLPPHADYYAIESQAPTAMLLGDGRVDFSSGGGGALVAVQDNPGTLRLTVGKKDAATGGSPQPGLSFEGAEYTAVSISTEGWQATATTDAQGTLVFEDVPLGTVRIMETRAPVGYRIDPEAHEYTVGPEQLGASGVIELVPENDFVEVPIAFDIEIAKFNGDGSSESGLERPAEGVSFEVVSNATREVVGILTTGADGYVSSAGQWFGDGERDGHINGAIPYNRDGYTIREVASTVPDGYERADDWNITAEQMVDGSTLRYIVNNSPLTTRVQIVKRDRESGLPVPLAGFSFSLFDSEGALVEQEIWYPSHERVSEFQTDETGCVTLPEPLRTGSYEIRETAAMAPYLLAQDSIPLVITGTEGMIEPLVVATVENDVATGQATIRKTCSKDGEPLAGAVFDIIAEKDIVSPDGRVQAVAGQKMGTVTTGADGTATLDGLPLGSGTARYTFREVTPPDGYARNDAPVPFALSYQDQKTPVVAATVEVADEPTVLTVNKIDEVRGQGLPEATFGLWREEDEVRIEGEEGFGSVAIRVDEAGDGDVSLIATADESAVRLEADEGLTVLATDSEGHTVNLSEVNALEAGIYTLSCSD